jgi:hypothetical protein
MAKNRLNNRHRSELRRFAFESIKCDDEKKAWTDSRDAIKKICLAAVNKEYPVADMKILEKYNCVHHDRCIKLAHPDGRVIGFDFLHDESDEFPMVPGASWNCNNRIYKATEEDYFAVVESNRLKTIWNEKVEEKKMAYRSLISNARYFEDVVEVWPAAESLRHRITGVSTALSVISKDVIDFIKSDNAGTVAEKEEMAA